MSEPVWPAEKFTMWVEGTPSTPHSRSKRSEHCWLKACTLKGCLSVVPAVLRATWSQSSQREAFWAVNMLPWGLPLKENWGQSLPPRPSLQLKSSQKGWTAIQDRRGTPGLERAQRGLCSPRPEKLTSGKPEPHCYVIYDFLFCCVFFFLFLLNHSHLISEDFEGFFFL